MAAILCFAALGAPAAAAPQAGPAPAGVEVFGRIVDAVTGTAMGGATVVIEPDVAGAFPGAAAGSGFVAAARSTTTDSTGRYRFDGLAPGPYRLHAARYGSLIRTEYGEPFHTIETMRVDDVVGLDVRSI